MKRLGLHSILAIWVLAASIFPSCTDVEETYYSPVPTDTTVLRVMVYPSLVGSIFDYVDVESIIMNVNGVDTTIVYNDDDPVLEMVFKKLPVDITYRLKYKLRTDAIPKSDNKFSVYSLLVCHYLSRISITAPTTAGDSHTVFHERDYIPGDRIAAWVDSCNNSMTTGHFTIDKDGTFTELSPQPNPNNITFNSVQRANVRAEVSLSGSLFDVVEAEMICKCNDDEESVIPCINGMNRWINDLDAFHFPANLSYRIRYKIKPGAKIIENEPYTWQTSYGFWIDYTYSNRFHDTAGTSTNIIHSNIKGSDIPNWVERENAKNQIYEVRLNDKGKWLK